MRREPDPLAKQLGIREVINGRSFSTKCGGSLLDDEVIEAMRQASKLYFRIEDLQEAAGAVIAGVTGAEAGYVTSGASAALTLAMAACMTGLDPGKMNRLPDTSGMKNEVIIQRGHRNDYDHALRVAGAAIKEVGFAYATFPYELEQAIDSNTAAVFHLAGVEDGSLPLPVVARIAHSRNVPVIVDASPQLPPRENLRLFIEQGADLVAFSGGKHIRGPQASGILCGRRDLILAVAFQHQDMDVFPETWTYRGLIDEGRISGPPHHGIGRGFKAGKEEIVGLLVALRRYMERDIQAEIRCWHEAAREIAEGANAIVGLSGTVHCPPDNIKPLPAALITVDPPSFGMDAHAAINALQEGDPIITVFEGLANHGILKIFPDALRPGDGKLIVERLREIGRTA
jgi:D-glucosaminate-6-phosphate ammonia-lyase